MSEQYVIRRAVEEDAESLLDIQQSVISEGDYLITVSEEFSNTPTQQRDWINNILENERETLLIAETDGKAVGWIVFHIQNRKRMTHTGSIGMMVRKQYRGRGIGTLLLQALIDWAKENPLIEKMSLGVFSTNHRALSLYKKMGFVEEGRKINEFKIADNEYVDDILMYQFVHN
ncbi:GNAT family N-acetyltransferase [Rossellomorea sp. AcN35-11]|nr:GNAT family N-acetyltransferase [Rossellomorea aquimaris]WJV29667.1 GNAT family N-acetyltransferase [Rossellomorea sp. AcN35-11]